MEDKVLTPQQTKRIEEEAKEFANNRTTDSQAYKIGAQVGYVYGATSEALRNIELEKENEAFRTVMLAAAEEINEHWDAHCDDEGYGPSSLLRRLEQAIPVQYGYTAGRFEELKKENQHLQSQLKAEALRGKELVKHLEEDFTILISIREDLKPETLGRMFVDNRIKHLQQALKNYNEKI